MREVSDNDCWVSFQLVKGEIIIKTNKTRFVKDIRTLAFYLLRVMALLMLADLLYECGVKTVWIVFVLAMLACK